MVVSPGDPKNREGAEGAAPDDADSTSEQSSEAPFDPGDGLEAERPETHRPGFPRPS